MVWVARWEWSCVGGAGCAVGAFARALDAQPPKPPDNGSIMAVDAAQLPVPVPVIVRAAVGAVLLAVVVAAQSVGGGDGGGRARVEEN